MDKKLEHSINAMKKVSKEFKNGNYDFSNIISGMNNALKPFYEEQYNIPTGDKLHNVKITITERNDNNDAIKLADHFISLKELT
jgi:hypothetical protein